MQIIPINDCHTNPFMGNDSMNTICLWPVYSVVSKNTNTNGLPYIRHKHKLIKLSVYA